MYIKIKIPKIIKRFLPNHKICYKCNKFRRHTPSKLKYYKSRPLAGCRCNKCMKEFKRKEGIKEIRRIETPNSMFSCKFEYYEEKNT